MCWFSYVIKVMPRRGTAHYSDEGNGFVALCLMRFGIVTVKLVRVSYHVAAVMVKLDQVVCGCRYGKVESDQVTAEPHFITVRVWCDKVLHWRREGGDILHNRDP